MSQRKQKIVQFFVADAWALVLVCVFIVREGVAKLVIFAMQVVL